MEIITGYFVSDFINPYNGIMAFKMFYASLLGFLIGWNRRSKNAGIRTFTLITLGAAMFTVISIHGFPNNADTADHARVVAQIVSGIGFLGVGVIWKDHGALTGLTTAAGIWVAAAVGIAVGTGMFMFATLGTFLILAIFSTKKYLRHYEKEDNSSANEQ